MILDFFITELRLAQILKRIGEWRVEGLKIVSFDTAMRQCDCDLNLNQQSAILYFLSTVIFYADLSFLKSPSIASKCIFDRNFIREITLEFYLILMFIKNNTFSRISVEIRLTGR
jgi:hypothetical protein